MLNFHESKRLVKDALGALVNDTCPYCESQGLVSRFISDDDIDKFVREHPLVIVMSGQPGLPIGKEAKTDDS